MTQVIRNMVANGSSSFFANHMDSADNADWAVNALAVLAADTNNIALNVRLFDDTIEEGCGCVLEIPDNMTNIIFKFRSRAETGAASNLGVRPKLYVREIPDNLAVEAWDAGTLMDALTMGTSNEFFQLDEQEFSLSSLGLVAGRILQFEITRIGADASDTLVGDWALLQVEVSFT